MYHANQTAMCCNIGIFAKQTMPTNYAIV